MGVNLCIWAPALPTEILPNIFQAHLERKQTGLQFRALMTALHRFLKIRLMLSRGFSASPQRPGSKMLYHGKYMKILNATVKPISWNSYNIIVLFSSKDANKCVKL